MQRILSGVLVTENKASKRNLSESKNIAFDKLCEWYENTECDVYTIKQVSRKLLERYGDKIRFTNVSGLCLCC